MDLRDEYRHNNEYAKSDAIRDRLTLLGVVIKDHSEGPTTWHFGGESTE